jgi:hypothetical protein
VTGLQLVFSQFRKLGGHRKPMLRCLYSLVEGSRRPPMLQALFELVRPWWGPSTTSCSIELGPKDKLHLVACFAGRVLDSNLSSGWIRPWYEMLLDLVEAANPAGGADGPLA